MQTAESFCNWLEGAIDAHEFFTPGAPMDKTKIDMIQAKLSDVFRHEIDPSFPADLQHALHDAHKGTQTPVVIDGVKMGKDGVTPDSGMYFDANSWNHDPQARC